MGGEAVVVVILRKYVQTKILRCLSRFFCLFPLSPPPDTAGEERRGVGRLLLPNNPFLLLDPDSFTRKKKKKKGVSNNQPPSPHMENEGKRSFLFRVPNFEFKDWIFIVKGKGLVVAAFDIFSVLCARAPQIFLLFRHLRFFFLNNNNKTGT